MSSVSQHADICSSCCDDLIEAPLNWICPYLANLNTADIMQIHTSLSLSLTYEQRYHLQVDRKKALIFFLIWLLLGTGMVSKTLLSCLFHTCQRPTDVRSLRRIFVRTTTPSPSSNPGWAKTIRQHLSWAQASCTAHYLHSHSHTQTLFCSSQTHNGSECEYTEYIHKRVVILRVPSLIKVWAVPHLSSSAHH